MAYTIVKSDGTILTTIPEGTINTTSTSLGLPGRNFAGYGQAVDTDLVHITENFADSTPPPNPIKGQLWFNTNNNIMYICPADGEANALAWLALTATSSGGTTTFGSVVITGNLVANNITATNNSNANAATFSFLTVTVSASVANANLSGTTTIANTVTTAITSGSRTTAGNLTGTWTMTGGLNGNSVIVANGNVVISNTAGAGLWVDPNNLYDLSGNVISLGSTYSNANVQALLPVYNGNILAANVTTPIITTGANTSPGTITGNWTLTTGSRLQATYADLAERFAADDVYEPGTVVQIGGSKEITAVKYELSEDVFGVISNTAAYLMNSGAGADDTHPPVAVSGRVQVKVKGTVNKGDRLVSAGQGLAKSAKPGEATAFNTIGRALQDKTTDDLGTVEAIVMIRL